MQKITATERTNMSYFTGAFIVTAIAVTLGFFYGFMSGGGLSGATATGLTAGLSTGAVTVVLCILEITLSFDNAVVNATILKNWDAKWRHAFLIFGILFAVVGMRLTFPIILVAITSEHFSFQGIAWVVNLAFTSPKDYALALGNSKYLVEAFGGAFLLMIATEFFLDTEKTDHWLGPIESRLTGLGQIEAIQALITLTTVLVVSHYMAPQVEQTGFMLAGVLGVMGFIASKGLGTLLGGDEAEAGTKIVRASVAGFLYLELLDASFSFDGVIGAFAITTSLPIIMLGLGSGAFWVRSMTVWLVDHDKLAEYRYLAHGAYYAIGILACFMFASAKYEIPDVITGLTGGILIGASFISSIVANKHDAANSTNEVATAA